MSEPTAIDVQIVCAVPGKQVLRSVRLPPASRVSDALRESAVLAEFAELDPATLSYAVWGVRVASGDELRDGDRLEILRELAVDPREARRRRAALRAQNKSRTEREPRR